MTEHDPTKSPLTVAVEDVDEGRAAVVSACGDVDLRTVDVLRGGLASALDRPRLDVVVVDLREVEFLGSVGLEALLEAEQRARTTGRELRLVVGEEHVVTRLLRITALDGTLRAHPTIEDVLVSVPRNPA